jgi:Fe-S-cluster containining protein
MSGSDNDTFQNGSALYLSCGLCCDGVLHSHVPLLPEEIDRAGQQGLSPFARGERYVFLQPCPCYNGTECSIYSKRPNACHAYQCKLLKKYTQGTIGLEESTKLVRTVKHLVLALQTQSGTTSHSKRIWQQIEEYMQDKGGGTAEFRQAYPEFMMDLAMLRVLCKRHFQSRIEQDKDVTG